jgi:hypothetical protein
VSCWLKSGGVYQREQRKSTCSLKERRIVSPDSFSRQEDRINRISRINKSGFRKRRTPQNDPIGFALIHSPSVLSVSFDSLRSLLRSCLRQSISLWSVVVNSAGFGLNGQRSRTSIDDRIPYGGRGFAKHAYQACGDFLLRLLGRSY